MKKYILSLLTFFGLFVLSGCGGGSDNISNSDPIVEESNPAVDVRLSDMLINGNAYTLDVTFVKKVDSTYQIELSDFDLKTDSCLLNSVPVFTPKTVYLNDGISSSAIVSISGTFDKNCETTNYTFTATQKTTKDGKVDIRTFSVSPDATVPVPSSGFFNATTPLEVTEANSAYEIKVQVLEDGYVASGKTVKLKPFSSQYGSVDSYETLTGTDGYAVFNYTSPDTLPMDGTSTLLQLTYDDEGTILTQNVVLTFKNEGSLDKVEKLYVVPNELVITSGGEEKEITILTLNAQNIGVSSTVVLEQLSDGVHDYGRFDPSGTITTDASGKAVVKYIAPASISGISERNITVTETTQNLTQELNIKYNTATGPGIDYEIEVKVPAALNIEDTDQITVTIHELGNPSVTIDDNNVHEVNLVSTTANILTFNGASTESYMNVATKPIAVTTDKLSGTAVVEINASIYNGEKDIVLQTVVPITVLSGPVTAMSLVYTGTDEDSALGLNKNYYTIHAVDKYNNPAKAGIMLHPSIINGTKVIKSPRMEANPQGKIDQGASATFEDLTMDFTSAVDTNDILAIVPNQNNFDKNYLGNWSIDNVSSTLLELAEESFVTTAPGLSYVIGNSKRIMLNDNIATVDVQPRDGTFATDDNGNVRLVVTFDPILSGHTVTISANAYDEGIRTGIAQINGLRWGNYNSTTESVDNDGSDYKVSLQLGINNLSDSPIEALMDVDIVPSSIESTSTQCYLNTSLPMDLNPDENGYIWFFITTKKTDLSVTECDITWSKSNASIFKEY